MYSSLTTSSILISETQQSTTCWVEQYVPGGSVLLKTIMEYSFALGCSVATLNHNSEMIFVLHFLSFGFSVETLLRIHFGVYSISLHSVFLSNSQKYLLNNFYSHNYFSSLLILDYTNPHMKLEIVFVTLIIDLSKPLAEEM